MVAVTCPRKTVSLPGIPMIQPGTAGLRPVRHLYFWSAVGGFTETDNGLCGAAKACYAQTFAALIALPPSISGCVTREMVRQKQNPSILLFIYSAMEQNESG